MNLQPYLKGGVKDENDYAAEASKLSSCSFLTKFLLLTTVLMAVTAPTLILNEAKLTKEERSRLWVRKLAYCSSSLFPKMKSMPEYGNMPDIWEVKIFKYNSIDKMIFKYNKIELYNFYNIVCKNYNHV